MSHDAAADTSLAPLPGRARHTHSGMKGCWQVGGHYERIPEVAWVGEPWVECACWNQVLVPSILPSGPGEALDGQAMLWCSVSWYLAQIAACW